MKLSFINEKKCILDNFMSILNKTKNNTEIRLDKSKSLN